MNDPILSQIIRDTAQLVRAQANRRGLVTLSPETAAALECISANPSVHAEAAIPENRAPSTGVSVADELAALAAEVSGCRKCGLCEGRTQTVFADGNPSADIVFVGEAPGEQEDRKGVPFVGRAGQLLTDIIVKGMMLKRSEVYICNVIKCRPPENRDPKAEEIAECEPYLIRQLELVQPKVICALGGHAAKTLLRTEESTGRLRNKWHFYQGIPLRVTYHPAYLLRSPGEKAKTWADIQEVMKVLSGEIDPKPEAIQPLS